MFVVSSLWTNLTAYLTDLVLVIVIVMVIVLVLVLLLIVIVASISTAKPLDDSVM